MLQTGRSSSLYLQNDGRVFRGTQSANRRSMRRMDAGTDLARSLDAFLQEHRRCGDIDADVTNTHVLMWCSCGGRLTRSLDAHRLRLGGCLAAFGGWGATGCPPARRPKPTTP